MLWVTQFHHHAALVVIMVMVDIMAEDNYIVGDLLYAKHS